MNPASFAITSLRQSLAGNMSRQPSGHQSLRSASDNVFAASQTTGLRTQTQRLQNSKLSGTGPATTWGFGGVAPASMANAPSRMGTLSNFAQAIGGAGIPSQNTSLDLSEFPSLSGGPQSLSQPSTSQAWNNNTTTAPRTQSGSQRPSTATNALQRPSNDPPSSIATRSNNNANNSSFAFGSSLEGRFDGAGQRMANLAAGPDSLQQTVPDDFPPLNGLGGTSFADDRAVGMNQVNGHVNPDNNTLSAIGMGVRPNADERARAPPQGSQRDPGGPQQESWSHDALNPSQQQPLRENGFAAAQQAPTGQASVQQQQQGSSFGTQMIVTAPPGDQSPRSQRSLSDMTEAEKWGLPGLLAMLPGRGSGPMSSLIMGQDLASLGLDFDSSTPLSSTISTPFADPSSRPAIPEYTLPTAYSVNNVPALHTRIGNFTDETLFAIFYQYTRDVMQEIAANELYTRDWRWHKELRQWMMKDAGMAPPIRISERSERGVYVFFDAVNWRRERRDFVLNYDHLDQRHGPTQPIATQ